MEGFIVVDPSQLQGPEHAMQLAERIQTYRGWPTPDGRWVLTVEGPTFARDRWVKEGWPKEALEIAK